MLNFLILLILMFSLVTALFNGKIDFLCNQLLDFLMTHSCQE